MSPMEAGNISFRLNPKPYEKYYDIKRLRASERSRAWSEGDVLEREVKPDFPPVDARLSVAIRSLKEQIKRVAHSEDPKGAVRTTLGVLLHGAPMTLDEIAGLTLDDIATVKCELEALVDLGLVAKRSFTNCEAYQIPLPREDQSSTSSQHSTQVS